MIDKRTGLTIPTEDAEQMMLMSWVTLMSSSRPELKMLYHIPNGGSRHKAEAGRFRAMGVRPGVPDLCLPVAIGGKHGLYIELKRVKGGRVSEEQAAWIAELRARGYAAEVCRGWEEAAGVILRYLRGERPLPMTPDKNQGS